ncbi:hypothetical protein CK556_03735 [Mesoplasma chauliocola]|uniref:Uncharacterized protein n=1 Tax=Mesoplasma chauliocola TaxID=216427 RepID=A0A249SP82_9MOLU|nr:hypothetical protein CK556_03735 [Mesoplasma chauliocola]
MKIFLSFSVNKNLIIKKITSSFSLICFVKQYIKNLKSYIKLTFEFKIERLISKIDKGVKWKK